MPTDADPTVPALGPWDKGVGRADLRRDRVRAERPAFTGPDFALPLLLLRERALEHNLDLMLSWAREHGVELAPHAKTAMSVDLVWRQLDAGCWGTTVASVQQAAALARGGITRLLIANEVVDPAGVAWLAAAGAEDLEVSCFVDSVAGVRRLEQHVTPGRPIAVLVEVGLAGGRAGCRDLSAAVEVARAAAASDATELVGVAAFEGIVGWDALDRIDGLLHLIVDTAEACDREQLWADGRQPILSAGGSIFFGQTAEVLRTARLTTDPLIVLRSGCYLTHDSGFYDRMSPWGSERADSRRLRPAIELWAAVLSRPEPGRVILGFGKRDASFDLDLPTPLSVRDEYGAQREAAGWTVAALNDQHAMVDLPVQDPAQVGDLVCLGLSHPCTAFDKWRQVLLVDDEDRALDVLPTSF
jgi:D-serine deaminase-like pyridoxal phosphate-dependent protein